MLEGRADSISGIRVIDDHTLEVTIDSPKVYFLDKLTQPVAYIVDESNVSSGSNWYEQPNGTGPFKLQSWEKNSLMILERNDDYYAAPAKLKHVVYKLFAGYSVQLYESGEIDMAGVGLTDLERVQDPSNPLNKELYTRSGLNTGYIGLNVTKPPFDDPRIRQAFALALDIPKLVEISLKGQAQRAAGSLPEGMPGYNPGLQPFALDVAGAKQLIAESKYGSVSKFPPITLYAAYGLSSLEEAVIGMWQQNLGVQIRVEVISELDTYLQRCRNDEFQVFISGWGADYIDPQNFLDVLFRSESPENAFAYINPAVDSALAQAAGEMDEAKRLQVYRDIEKLILADLPVIPLFRNMQDCILVKPYVRGYVAAPVGVNIWCDLYVVPH
jgi:oligopeptide transport system substrate-binding protein